MAMGSFCVTRQRPPVQTDHSYTATSNPSLPAPADRSEPASDDGTVRVPVRYYIKNNINLLSFLFFNMDDDIHTTPLKAPPIVASPRFLSLSRPGATTPE
eukprot:scaffold131232_cov46-Attheya_sp.AAC.1